MKISTKGRYAIRILLDLAQHSDGSNVSVHQISQRQGISEKYLEVIIAKLNHANFVRSIRGKYGGYQLVGNLIDYTVYDVLIATEDSMAIVSCLDGCGCAREDYCKTIAFWTQLQDYIHSYLKSVTLQDVLDGNYKPLSR